MKKKSEPLPSLLALRVSDDLTADEARSVDEFVRYDARAKAELAAYSRTLELLREAGSEPSPIDDRPSLWGRIEPRLGPAGRRRRRPLYWISTGQLAAACLALFVVTIYREAGPDRVGKVNPWVGQGGAVPVSMGGLTAPLARPALGVVVQDLNSTVRQRLGSMATAGVSVVQTLPGLPADQAGLRAGDVIVAVNGQRVASAPRFVELVTRLEMGQPVELSILRDGKLIGISVRLGQPQSNNAGSNANWFADVDVPIGVGMA